MSNLQDPHLPTSLTDALVPSAPPSTYYISNFLTTAEQFQLLQKINSVPLPQWRHLSHRRLQAHPSPLTPSNTLLSAPLPAWLQEPIISRLLSIPLHDPQPSNTKDDDENIFTHAPHGAPNHCLVNEYLSGQGIHPHEDGAAYHPVVATVSLGAPIVLDVYRKNNADLQKEEKRPACRILQEPGSLLISTGEMYTEYLHGIAEVRVDEDLHGGEGGTVNWDLLSEEWRTKFKEAGGQWTRETRVSATFRDVLSVKKMGKGLGFLAGNKR